MNFVTAILCAISAVIWIAEADIYRNKTRFAKRRFKRLAMLSLQYFLGIVFAFIAFDFFLRGLIG